MSKRGESHHLWPDICYVYICMYGKKREKLCDFSCADTDKPCKNFINAHWKICRLNHYHKKKPKFPTTLEAWKNRVKPF